MARAFIRGSSFAQYLKVGYNVVVRYQKGNEPDDKNDFFELIGYSKNLETAKRLQTKHNAETEIMFFKIQEVETVNQSPQR